MSLNDIAITSQQRMFIVWLGERGECSLHGAKKEFSLGADGIIYSLRHKGLVSMEFDGRRYCVTLTPMGRKLYNELKKAVGRR